MIAMRLMSSETPWIRSKVKARGTRKLAGYTGNPPAFVDCSFCIRERQKNGQPKTVRMVATGIKKKRWPITSIQSRARLGNKLFTMSMRMCSFDSSVQDEQSRKTIPKRTHWSSSHEFDDTLKILRIVALTALTSIAIKTHHAIICPSRVLNLSTERLNLSRPLIVFLLMRSPSKPAGCSLSLCQHTRRPGLHKLGFQSGGIVDFSVFAQPLTAQQG